MAEVGIKAEATKISTASKPATNGVIDIGLGTAEMISSNSNQPVINSNDVLFEVKYSAGYKGEKTMPEGIVIISKESADHFESIGIGKVAGSEEVKKKK